MLHPARDRHDARQRARRLETADADRTDSGLNAKTRNDARVHSRGRVHAHVDESRRVTRYSNRATRLFRKSFQKCLAVAPRAPASVCPRRASDGPQAMATQTWTGCWRCTPPRWWTSRRSADRTCASSWRCASRALRGGLARPPAPAKPWPAPPRPRRWTRAGATRRARAIRRTKVGRGGHEGQTARATRRAGSDARGVGLPSAVHAELYKNTGGGPLPQRRSRTAGFVRRRIRDPEGWAASPRWCSRRSPTRAPRRDLNGASRRLWRDARARRGDGSLERRLSADAFSALKTLAASGARPRRAGARARGAPPGDAGQGAARKRDSMASVFRREFVVTRRRDRPPRGRWRAPPRPSSDADDEKEGKKPRRAVADPRAGARVRRRALRVARVGGDRRARQGRARRGLGRAGGAAASEAAFAGAAAFAVADVSFPSAATFLRGIRLRRNFKSVRRTRRRRDPPARTRWRLARGPREVGSSRALRFREETRRVRNRAAEKRERARRVGAAQRVPWLVFASDDVRAYAYSRRRRGAGVPRTSTARALQDEVQYCVRDDVATTAPSSSSRRAHRAGADVDRVALAAYAAAGEAPCVAARRGRHHSQVSFPKTGSTRGPPRVSFDGPSAGTAAAVAAEPRWARASPRVAGGAGGPTPASRRAGFARRLRAVAARALPRGHHGGARAIGTVLGHFGRLSASLAAAAWADLSKDMHRAFGNGTRVWWSPSRWRARTAEPPCATPRGP